MVGNTRWQESKTLRIREQSVYYYFPQIKQNIYLQSFWHIEVMGEIPWNVITRGDLSSDDYKIPRCFQAKDYISLSYNWKKIKLEEIIFLLMTL